MLPSLLCLRPKPPFVLRNRLTQVTPSFFFSTSSTIPLVTTTVLKECKTLIKAKLIHQQILVQGLILHVNNLIGTYITCDSPTDAILVLERLEPSSPMVFWWNALIRRAVRRGFLNEVLGLYHQMMRLGWKPDEYTFPFVFKACGELPSFRRGASVHGVVCGNGFESNVFVCNAVVAMYGRVSRFTGFSVRSGLLDDVFVGNAIVDMYAKCRMMDEANKVFERMEVQGCGFLECYGYWVFSDCQMPLPSCLYFQVVQSAGALLHGRETHCYAIKFILNLEGHDTGDDLMVINGLVDMYSKCKSSKVARMLFDSISPKDRNVVSWTVMIGGYAQTGDANDALQLFSQMFPSVKSIKPNDFTISCVLMACARLAALRFGRQIHAYVLRNHYDSALPFVANCLIDMYSKSGDVDTAQIVFENMQQKNAVSWTSLMTGYGMHGRGEDSLRVFDQMRKMGLVPDGITFLVVLYACNHSGMVDRGINYFYSMSKDFGVVPGVEHYACMVDLLGRAGRLDEALTLINDMPVEPTPIIWVALLSACRLHSNVELGERWKDVARVRSLMRHTGIKKRPGCSWVQGKRGTAAFFVGDRSHPLSQKIYETLADLIQRIKAIGYVPQTSFALHDVDDEEKGDLLFEHSEKLALAYGILTSPPGAPIRITKNLRVCGDCHNAITYISMIVEHEIILRDSSRFHHFKKGSCSCKGYW
ncbi:Pentatricopeptide repeat-containing protein family [Quillaja saponaria]|uniref:Pentatricopeptide repeat-containing protein family n=1 Tax=Quillaja saponaria TaxID=32244 RepID=A0AAD7LM66_QUISA|nr:Pentatricopeptide repeat-containing protein family [Quillaja saponaria]